MLDQRSLMFQAEDRALGWAFTLSGPPKAEVTVRQFAQNIGLAVAALAPAAEDAPASAQGARQTSWRSSLSSRRPGVPKSSHIHQSGSYRCQSRGSG